MQIVDKQFHLIINRLIVLYIYIYGISNSKILDSKHPKTLSLSTIHVLVGIYIYGSQLKELNGTRTIYRA
jgi:hypothetical protein